MAFKKKTTLENGVSVEYINIDPQIGFLLLNKKTGSDIQPGFHAKFDFYINEEIRRTGYQPIKSIQFFIPFDSSNIQGNLKDAMFKTAYDYIKQILSTGLNIQEFDIFKDAEDC